MVEQRELAKRMTRLRDELARSGQKRLDRIARESGLPIARLRELVRGEEATLQEARNIAAVLRIGLEELIVGPSEAETRAQVLFRRSWRHGGDRPLTTDGLAKRVAASVDLLRSRPDNTLTSWQSKFSRAEASIRSAEDNAATYRSIFLADDQLSPFTSLPEIVAGKMGVLLFVVRNAEMDGASAYLNGIPFVFVSERFRPRMLFTLAHEVGHLIAHHHPDSESAIIDEDVESPANRANALVENYANAFASALLMPRPAVGVALQTIRRVARAADDSVGDIEVNYLARIFGVSFWAAARRCEDLQILPSGGAFALNEEVARRHGSAERRANELGLPPRLEIIFPTVPPTLLNSAVASIRAGDVSIGRVAGLLGLSVADMFDANAPTQH